MVNSSFSKKEKKNKATNQKKKEKTSRLQLCYQLLVK